jgi:hypothetical protein
MLSMEGVPFHMGISFRRLDHRFIFHRLGCHLMKTFFLPWTWLLSHEIFLFHRLGCCLMKCFVSIDLGVVL